jgi:hypothetical protein
LLGSSATASVPFPGRSASTTPGRCLACGNRSLEQTDAGQESWLWGFKKKKEGRPRTEHLENMLLNANIYWYWECTRKITSVVYSGRNLFMSKLVTFLLVFFSVLHVPFDLSPEFRLVLFGTRIFMHFCFSPCRDEVNPTLSSLIFSLYKPSECLPATFLLFYYFLHLCRDVIFLHNDTWSYGSSFGRARKKAIRGIVLNAKPLTARRNKLNALFALRNTGQLKTQKITR